jgi:hypothetical protein
VTSTVNEVSKALLGLADYDLISLRIDSIAVGLLIVLLAEREVLAAYRGRAPKPQLGGLLVAIGPLLAAFVLVVVVRIFDVR